MIKIREFCPIEDGGQAINEIFLFSKIMYLNTIHAQHNLDEVNLIQFNVTKIMLLFLENQILKITILNYLKILASSMIFTLLKKCSSLKQTVPFLLFMKL